MNVSSLSRSPLLQTSNATREAALFCSDITIALPISAAHADAMIDESLQTYPKFGSPVIPVVSPIDGGLRMRVLNPDHTNQWLTATGDAILNYVLHDSSLNLNDL